MGREGAAKLRLGRRPAVEGKAAGLVDVNVVAFSETHSANKFVIPKAKR
jgi:hypothetical protein